MFGFSFTIAHRYEVTGVCLLLKKQFDLTAMQNPRNFYFSCSVNLWCSCGVPVSRILLSRLLSIQKSSSRREMWEGRSYNSCGDDNRKIEIQYLYIVKRTCPDRITPVKLCLKKIGHIDWWILFKLPIKFMRKVKNDYKGNM